MGQSTSTGMRNTFQRARNEIAAAYTKTYLTQGMSPADAQNNAMAQAGQTVLTRSYIRLEQPIVAGQNLINFPVLKNSTNNGNAIRSNEVRLNQQDTFFASDVAFYITKASSATATNFVPDTYPNAVTFPTGASTLYNLYNGYLNISVNESVIMPRYPMSNFLKVYQTQLTAATNSPIDQFDPLDVVFWEPMLNFVGTNNTIINVVMQNAVTPDANTYGIFVFHGALAQNSTIMAS